MRNALTQLGDLARELSFARTLIVADPGIVATGYVARAASILEAAPIHSCQHTDVRSPKLAAAAIS